MLMNILLAIIGLSCGFAVSAGIFAFIMSLGIIERLAAFSRTVPYIKFYETVVLAGATAGNIFSIYNLNIRIGEAAAGILGLLGGVFTGIMAITLVEMLKSIPIMLRRANIHKGLGTIVLAIALGKLFGSLLQFFKGWTV